VLVEPAAGRAIVERNMGVLRILIPSARPAPVIMFLGVWLCGWAVGEFAAINALLGGKTGKAAPGFLAFWLIGWTFGGGFAMIAWLWAMFGREIIVVDKQALRLRKQVLMWRRDREYAAANVGPLRIVETEMASLAGSRSSRRQQTPISTSPIAFAYGAKTIRFGNGIDPAEAAQLIAKIEEALRPAKSSWG
jgi:hypothetical protein